MIRLGKLAKGRRTTYEASQLEYKDRGKECRFQPEVLVGFPPHGLEGAQCEEECRAVPPVQIQAAKLIGDLGDGGCNNGLECQLGFTVWVRTTLTMSRATRKMLRTRATTMKMSRVESG